MRQDVPVRARGNTLFRGNAVAAAGSRLFGSVSVVLPPGSLVTLLVSILALFALGCVAWFVEIPQRARAVGVLMPPGGFTDVVADAPGRIAGIEVTEGQTIEAGGAIARVTTDQSDLALANMQSLQAEVLLLDAANERQAALDRSQVLAFDEQLDSHRRQLAAARSEYELQQQQILLLERQLARRQGLADRGNVAIDALDREQSQLLAARAAGVALRRTIIDIEQRAAGNVRGQAEALDEAARRQILHALERRRLERRVEEHAYLVERQISAPHAGTVARVIARAGSAVRAGDTLVRIYRQDQAVEAWLYLPSAKAGFLRAGQSVQLQLDAYPHQLFGLKNAVVTSISTIAMVPQDVSVPLLLPGPVFEVRATLDQAYVDAFNASWPLAPGTSFQADLIQRRYRLYEWLLRAIVRGSDSHRA